MEELQKFLQTVNTNGILWLLEAKPGLFAMLEDGSGNSYIPVWASEAEAKANIGDDWENYNVTTMDIAEFITWTSTQVGCGMGCAFCASGSQGVVRSLTSDEIVAEYMAGRALGEITNIVVMGMGEPFANYDETMRALKLINAGKGPNLGARHITLSTCGVVPGFERLAAEGLQFELSVSLHAPNDELRSELMPVNRRWPLDELLAACADYTRKTKRIITFEYTVIKGVNDSRACAEELARQVKRVPMAKVNLIPLSPVSHRPDFKTPDESTMLMFLDVLMKNHVQTMLRRSRGKDADAACGQLKLRHAKDGI